MAAFFRLRAARNCLASFAPMAKKKSRVPARPRPVQPRRGVQAPQKRVERRGERRTRIWFPALGCVILVAAAAVGIAMAFRGGGAAESNGVDGPCATPDLPVEGALARR